MENIKKRYSINCPECGEKLQACRSLGHLLAMCDIGYGVCLNCKASMRLLYNDEEDTMRAEKWESEVEHE